MTIGEELRQIRKERKLTIEQVKGLTGLRIATISNMENNHYEPRLDTLRVLADAYGCELKIILKKRRQK